MNVIELSLSVVKYKSPVLYIALFPVESVFKPKFTSLLLATTFVVPSLCIEPPSQLGVSNPPIFATSSKVNVRFSLTTKPAFELPIISKPCPLTVISANNFPPSVSPVDESASHASIFSSPVIVYDGDLS